MKFLCNQRTLLAGVAMLTAGFISPTSVQADFNGLGHSGPIARYISYFGHPSSTSALTSYVGHSTVVSSYTIQASPVYTYQPVAYQYYYTPVMVTPVLPQVQAYYVATPHHQAKRAPAAAPAKKAESKAQPTVSPTYLYSNMTYAVSNPVVMVYPPLVTGFGQPYIMW
jgi:hypothetical protein